MYYNTDHTAYEQFQKYGLDQDFKNLQGFNVSFKDMTLVYGEICHKGVKRLRKYAKQHNIKCLVDMGCGVGKCVFLGKALGFEKCIGVEIVDYRINQAYGFLAKLPSSIKKDIELIRGDMYTSINIREKVHEPVLVFASNLVWSKDMNKRFYDKLSKECLPGSIIVASSTIDILPENIEFIEKENIPMSWQSASMAYVFKVKETNIHQDK